MTFSRSGIHHRLRTAVNAFDLKAALRYAIIGATQNGLSYCVTLLLISFGWQAWQAVLILTPPSIAISFLLNRKWSFAASTHVPGQFRRYIFAYAIAYVCAVAFTWLQEKLGVPSWLAALVTVGVSAAGLYCALNFWVFAGRSKQKIASFESAVR